MLLAEIRARGRVSKICVNKQQCSMARGVKKIDFKGSKPHSCGRSCDGFMPNIASSVQYDWKM